MLNLSQIAGIARALLPASWKDRIDQAEQLAKTFSPGKDGVAQLMAQHGKNKRDLQNAIKLLDNPILQKTLGRVPGLSDAIHGAANELLNTDFDAQSGANPPPPPPLGSRNPGQAGNNCAGDFRARLNRLRGVK